MARSPVSALPAKLSCGIVPVRRTQDGWRFLMLRAWRNWDFPKGMREAGESPLEAAVREMREETEIEDIHFDWGEDHVDTGPYSRNKTSRYYLARTEQERVVLPVAAELGRPEHHEYRWLDAETALRLSSPRVRTVVEWALSHLGI